MGELAEVEGIGRSCRYDPTATPHQHLVCVGCGRIIDVFPKTDFGPTLPDAERFGFVDIEVDVVYRGRCPECSRN